eukprot:763366-Hanusia_phi.AAC.1
MQAISQSPNSPVHQDFDMGPMRVGKDNARPGLLVTLDLDSYLASGQCRLLSIVRIDWDPCDCRVQLCAGLSQRVSSAGWRGECLKELRFGVFHAVSREETASKLCEHGGQGEEATFALLLQPTCLDAS